MALLTVDDLARDLKVRNEDLLRELVTMGFAVEGPESPLETEDPAALRAKLVNVLPRREVVEKRIKPTVIRRRVKERPPVPSQKEHVSPFEAAAETEMPEQTEEPPVTAEKTLASGQEGPRKPLKKMKKNEPARIIEMAPRPTAAEVEQSRPVQIAPYPEEGPEPDFRRLGVAERAGLASQGSPQEARREDRMSPGQPLEAGPREITQAGESVEADVELRERDASTPRREPLVPSRGRAEGVGEAPQAAKATPSAVTGDRRADEDRLPKKKKKKEKRMQPAQIIGKVELKKEPPREPERSRPEPPPPPPPSRAPRVVEPARPMPPSRGAPPPRTGVPPSRPTPPAGPTETISEEARRKGKKRGEKKGREPQREAVVEDDKAKVRRRKEVVLGADLYDERQRKGRLKGRKPRPRKTEITVPKASKRRIKLPEAVTVSSLAHKMSVKASEVIHHLITLGVTASMNEPVDFETATIVASEFGFEAEPAERSEETMLPTLVADTTENVVPRPPVITVMGHVDHGKTSLLDAIRRTHVTAQEAGGITQHIGAYKVRLDKGELVFLDTPGHEAFTAMRARGAHVTDFVVLVVAADDGVMEQTKEAINHARAAKVPIIVAINKVDKPGADPERVLRELSEHNLIPEVWGGDTVCTYVSAKTYQGVDEFLDMILLQSEMMELKANPNKKASATVIEARLDKGRGPVGTVLVKEGTLKLGDPFVTGLHFGKVRAMVDHEGRSIETAGPATPVEVQGFCGVPEAGEPFLVVEDEKTAREIAERRAFKLREQEAAGAPQATLEELLARMQQEETRELNLIIKGDVQGSVEALKEALIGIPSQIIKLKVIHSGVGAITESDIMLANASKASVIGFNVRPTPKTIQLAEQEKVEIRLYTIIYEAIEDVRKAMEGMLAPIEKESVVGRAEVRQTFQVAKVGMIAGCYVTWGKVERSNLVRLLRDNVVIYQGKIVSMKRFKDDIKDAAEGYECGLGLENFRDVKVGDVVEAYTIEHESAKLS